MSVNELELQIYHLALDRIDVESPERQDGQQVQMEAIRGGEEVLDPRKALYWLLQ
jgi:hypothetical protein